MASKANGMPPTEGMKADDVLMDGVGGDVSGTAALPSSLGVTVVMSRMLVNGSARPPKGSATPGYARTGRRTTMNCRLRR